MKSELVSGIFLPPEEEDKKGVVSRFISDKSEVIKGDPPQNREAYVRVTPSNGKKNGCVVIEKAKYGKYSTSGPSQILVLEVNNGGQKAHKNAIRLGYTEVEDGNGEKKKIAVDAYFRPYTLRDPTLDARLYS